MKALERVFIIILGVGLMLKVLKLPFATYSIMLGLALLACFYFLTSMAFLNGLKFSEVSDARARGVISSKHLSLAILSGLGLAEICVGLLFSSIHLPGGDFSLLIGLAISTLMIVLILLFIDSPSPMRRLGLYRLLVGVVVGAAAYIYYFPFVG